MLHQLALRHRRADRGWREGFAGSAERVAFGFERAIGQWNVIGDDDVARLHTFGDPVIGDIRAGIDHHELNIGRRAHERVGDDAHGAARAARDLVNLFLHGAGVSVDEDGGSQPSNSAAFGAKYVTMPSAPARLKAVRLSMMARSSSSQPFAAAAFIIAYSPETWNA